MKRDVEIKAIKDAISFLAFSLYREIGSNRYSEIQEILFGKKKRPKK